MDTKIQVRVGRLEEPLQTFSVAELVEKLETSNELLRSLGLCEGFNDAVQFWQFVCEPELRAGKPGFIQQGEAALRRLASKHGNWYLSTNVLALVAPLVDQNQRYVQSLTKRSRLHSKPGTFGAFANLQGDVLRLTAVVDRDGYCNKCGRLMNLVTEIHRNSAKCLQETAKRAGRSSGMSLVEQRDLKSALMKIPNSGAKLVPSEYELWAPKWVVSAYNIWKSNNKSYSDLNLTQFLQQMQPVDAETDTE